jgi:hypothetical protein
MPTEEDKPIYLRSLDDYWNEGKEGIADEIFSEDAAHHGVEVQLEGTVRERSTQRLSIYRGAART